MTYIHVQPNYSFSIAGYIFNGNLEQNPHLPTEPTAFKKALLNTTVEINSERYILAEVLHFNPDNGEFKLLVKENTH